MPSNDRYTFTNVEINGLRSACRIADGIIAEVGPAIVARPGDHVVDGRGGALLPGLADHHVHLWAAAAVRESLDLDGASDLGAVDPAAAAVKSPHAAVPSWLRVIGAGRLFERAELDQIWPDRPVRVQHRSGAVWMFNSAALILLADGLDQDERQTGQLWREDLRLRTTLDRLGASIRPDPGRLGADLAHRGITHLTDATPDLDVASVETLQGILPQHVLSLSPSGGTGPAKLVLRDDKPANFDDIVTFIRQWHETGRPVAIHAVTLGSLACAIAGLTETGSVAGDRIEHAAECDDALADRIAELGVVVVTQPGLWAHRGLDYRAGTPAESRPQLWRHAGLVRRGVQVALSSDAPYGPADPWQIIRAAVTRTLSDGSVGAPDERVEPNAALRSLLTHPLDPAGAPRAVEPGESADIVLLEAPLRQCLDAVVAGTITNPVRITLIAGRSIATSDSSGR
jgi:predicted amidohydrolase YtcJ